MFKKFLKMTLSVALVGLNISKAHANEGVSRAAIVAEDSENERLENKQAYEDALIEAEKKLAFLKAELAVARSRQAEEGPTVGRVILISAEVVGVTLAAVGAVSAIQLRMSPMYGRGGYADLSGLGYVINWAIAGAGIIIAAGSEKLMSLTPTQVEKLEKAIEKSEAEIKEARSLLK